MARPKDRAIKDQTRNLQDRGNRAKNKIKIALATQLRNDIGRLFKEETCTDLIIRVQGKDINIHKFIIKTRSIDIYKRFLELAGQTDQEDNVSILNMPDWLEYNTTKELLRQLYTAMPLDTFVDEVDGKYETLLKQNLLEQLSPWKPTPPDAETANLDKVKSDITTKTVDTVQNTDTCNHDNRINNIQDESACNDIVYASTCSFGDTHITQNKNTPDHTVVETKSNERSCVLEQEPDVNNGVGHDIADVVVDTAVVGSDTACSCKIEGNNNIDIGLPSTANDTHTTLNTVTMVTETSEKDNLNNDKNNSEMEINMEQNEAEEVTLDQTKSGEVTVNKTESGDLQPSLCDIIKLSYNISIPYETCSELGEDLLRGYLQEMDCDCVIDVSGTHFKAHKCILCVRSSYFSAMLSGSWAESSADELTLEGITPGVMEQILLYLYGGVIELNETCLLGELVMVADMYGIEGMKDVINFTLTKQLCHFFHKPCSVCETGVVDTLSSATTFNLPELKEKCIQWINKYMTKIWRNKTFALLPPEMMDSCCDTLISELTVNNVLEVMLDCQQLNRVIPHVRWSEPTLCAITKVMDKAIEFTSQNFIRLLTSSKFVHASRGLAYQMGLLEEIFEIVVKSIPISSACEIYLELYKRQPREGEDDDDDYLEEYKEFMKSLFNKCEKFMELHIHHVTQTVGWDLLSKDIQSQLLKNANFVCIDNISQTRRAKPKLTSMQKRTPSEVINDLKEDKRFMSTKSRSLKHPGSSKKSTSTDSQSKMAAHSKNQSNVSSSSNFPRKAKTSASSSVRKSRTGLLKKTAVESLRTDNSSGASSESIDSSGCSDGWSSVSSLDMVAKGASFSGNHGNRSGLQNVDTASVSSVYDEVADDQIVVCEADIELQLMNFKTDVEFAEPELFIYELIPILEFDFSQPES